jgi:hypothetical protein
LDGDWLEFYADEVFVALASVERVIRRALAAGGANTTVVLASAIGQEEIPAENHGCFVTIADPHAFLAAIFEGREFHGYRLYPTMVPDFTIQFDEAADADFACRRLSEFSVGENMAQETLERMTGKELVGEGTPRAHIRYHYAAANFKYPITFARSDGRTVHVSLQIDDYGGPPEARLGNRPVSFADIGLGVIHHDEGVNCTAQHCAEGSLVVRRPDATGTTEPKVVSSLDFVPSLLKHFGVETPAHLPGEAILQF